MTWIVTGGAGYIGAHVVHRLCAGRRDVVVFDDLSTGRADRLPAGVEVVRGSITDAGDLRRLFAGRRVDGVIHLAALKSVAESIAQPRRYEEVNVDGLRRLLDAMGAARVTRLVFSSSAAVYGHPEGAVVDELSPVEPLSPYGRTKLAGERLIATYPMRSVGLRQFNVIGAGGHRHAADRGGTNLLPAVFRALRPGGPAVRVLGSGYDTADGTAVRDYVHVEDVAEIYGAAVEHLLTRDGERHLVVNVGTGEGRTVFEVLRAAADAAHTPVPYRMAPPRDGDVPAVVAATGLAARRLQWKAERGLGEAVRSAWAAWAAAETAPVTG
ncbi:UDP-glucose 4-epimerase GalE [Actinoplanes sp. URMC 104]|uniref:UDP-glucose 4-epimerase GalE n=1 Tax=Actinoplanes sp. URMC 104 TaxID=3423409 RepID=UPI003F1A5496